MKLDRLQFAKVVAHVCGNGMSQGNWEIEHLDQLIDVAAPVQDSVRVSQEAVNELLDAFSRDNGFISAIKAYRSLTGATVKESKETIEKYRSFSKAHLDNNGYKDNGEEKAATLGDILHSAGRNKAGNDISGI